MAKLTRRSLLRNSFGLVAAGTLARPHIANAAATTAAVWWVEGAPVWWTVVGLGDYGSACIISS